MLDVSGSTATLKMTSGSDCSFYAFQDSYQSIAGLIIGQVIGGTEQAPIARVYEVAEMDTSSLKVRLVSIDNGVVYTADLQAADIWSVLTGTFSSQSIPASVSSSATGISIANHSTTSIGSASN